MAFLAVDTNELKVEISNKNHAVITADLISSGKLKNEERTIFIQWIESFGKMIEKEKAIYGILYPLSLFRGDSFQIVIENTEKALQLAMRMNSSLLALNKSKRLMHLEARMGIGIGDINYRRSRIEESDGEAFHISGKLLDEMKASRSDKLRLQTGIPEVDEEFAIHCQTLTLLSTSWSPGQSRVVSLALEKQTQQQIAESIGESQPAVNQKLRAASYRLLETILTRFEKKINEYQPHQK